MRYGPPPKLSQSTPDLSITTTFDLSTKLSHSAPHQGSPSLSINSTSRTPVVHTVRTWPRGHKMHLTPHEMGRSRPTHGGVYQHGCSGGYKVSQHHTDMRWAGAISPIRISRDHDHNGSGNSNSNQSDDLPSSSSSSLPFSGRNVVAWGEDSETEPESLPIKKKQPKKYVSSQTNSSPDVDAKATQVKLSQSH